MKRYLSGLSTDKSADYSLWKATKYLKRPIKHILPLKKADRTWAKSDANKAELLAEHLKNTFQPNEGLH